MTMRADFAREEPGRREQTLDAGAETLVSLCRFGRIAAAHDPSHPAFVRQLDQSHQALLDYSARAGRFFSAFFTPYGTFVGGELVRGGRVTQDAASELGSMLGVRGVAELVITKDVAQEDLLDLARFITSGTELRSPRIRVRGVSEVARTRGLAVEQLPVDRHIARIYSQAVVALRRLFDELLAGRYVMPARLKRMALEIVTLAQSQNPFLVGVTEAKHASHDEAACAVNAAFLTAAMAREIGADPERALEMVLSALLYDVAVPRMRARAVEQTGRSDEAPETDTELPAGTAATLATFVGLEERSMPRAVVAFESQWTRFTGSLGALYQGTQPMTLQARIVSVAHEWARLRAIKGAMRPRTIDDAVAALLEDRQDPSDLAVVRLLVATLRFFPVGTVVDLASGEIAEVVSAQEIGNGAPVVRVTVDPKGQPLARPIEIDLSTETHNARRHIVAVRSVEGWRRLERATSPADIARAPTPFRGSLPSISPGLIEGGPSNAADVQALRDEISEQLAEVLPRERSSPSLDDAAKSTAPREVARDEGGRSKRLVPSAKGTFQTTPLVHVLIYVLDHGISGSVELLEPAGIAHVISFRRGAPVKVKTGRLLAPLGELLAQSGQLLAERIPELVLGAQEAGTLFGEHLIMKGLVNRRHLWSALELQIPLKLERLANLPVETAYSLYRDVDLLEGFGGADAVAADAVHVIHSVVRKWHDRARVRAALARIAKHPLIVRPDAKVGGLKLSPDERSVVEVMRAEKATLSVLTHKRLADPEELQSLVYALAITRQLDLPGQKKAPMGVRAASLPMAPARPSTMPGGVPAKPRSPSSASLPAVPQASAAPQIAEAIATALSSPPSGSHSVPAVEVPQAARVPESMKSPLSQTQAPVSSAKGPVSSAKVPISSSKVPSSGAPSSSSRRSALPPPLSSPRSPSSSQRAAAPPASASFPPQEGSSGSRNAPPPSRERPPESSKSAGAPPSSRTPNSVRERARMASDALDAADRALSAMSSFRSAEAAMAKGDFDTAEGLVVDACDFDPEPIDYRAALIWIRAQGAPAEAVGAPIGALTDLLVELPAHPRVLLYRARLLRRQGRVREAIADYEEHLRVNPKGKEAAAELKALRGD